MADNPSPNHPGARNSPPRGPHHEPDLMARLTAPFALDRIRWNPQTVSKDQTKAMAVPYIDARDVAERLDQAVGPAGWQVDHKQANGHLLTGIGIKFNGECIWKWDAGLVARDNDEALSTKGSMSDGLKRAAVLWGIARYLYRVPRQWVAYDAQRKRITQTPLLPPWAVTKEVERA